MEFLIKKRASEKFSEMGVGTEKGQLWDTLSYDQKSQPRKPIKYFIMTKQIVCN